MELQLLRNIQTIANPMLDYLFIFLTMLGEQYVAVLVLTIVYWLWDKETGEYMSFSLLGSLCVNGVVKNVCKLPRPIGQEGVRTLRAHTATGYSFPSGHTQTITTLCTSLALSLRRRVVTIIAVVLPLLVGFSRLYLGVHWPKDVLVGLVLGVALSLLAFWAFENLNQSGREILYLVCAGSFVLLALLLGDEDFVKTAGLQAGFAAGTLLEHRFVGFSNRVSLRKKILRWVLGVVVLGVVKVGLSLVLPDYSVFILLEYAAVSVTAFYVCPLLFTKLNV